MTTTPTTAGTPTPPAANVTPEIRREAELLLDSLMRETGGHALLSVEEAATLLRSSRSKLYALIARDELPAVKIGGRTRVPVAWLADWLIAKRPAGNTVAARYGRASRRKPSTSRWCD